MAESTSAVQQAVQARIAAARIRVQAAKQRRQDFATARRHGLARRHAAKLRNLADTKRRAFCDGCNGTATTHDQITHDPWCTVT